MNWEMIGAIGEVAGAIAVVVTLVYLARQIRDQARQDRRARSAEFVRDTILAVDPIARDPSTAGIYLRGLRDEDSLTPEERVVFRALLLTVFRSQEAFFHFHLEEGVSEYQVEVGEAAVRDLIASPGAQAWWHARRHWFSEEFRAEVDRWISEGAEGWLASYDEGEREEVIAAPDEG